MNLPNGFTPAQIASCISPKRLDLTILPTEKCNFRCTYCYEDFLIGRMPDHVQRGVERLIERRAPDLKQLALNWFGGEPLLALPVIKRIASKALALSIEHGFELTGSMTTNAYALDRETLAQLVDLKQDFFQISLDGWGSQHDKTRRRADGAGTFDRIWQNLLDARDLEKEFEMLLRIHVTHENHDSLRKLCFEIGREFGGDQRYRLNFQDVRNMGGENGDKVVGVSAATFKAVAANLQNEFQRGSGNPANCADGVSRQADAVLQTSVTDPGTGESASGRRAYEIEAGAPYICYAAKPNFFLIRADGRVGKCTVALDDARNQLGHISPEGELVLRDERMRPWFGGFEHLDVDYLGCPIRFIEKPDEQLAHRPSVIPSTVVAEV